MILENFIVFEGLDGSGKTTQVNMLFKKLNMFNSSCLIKQTKEPSSNEIGLLIRRILKKEIKVDTKTLTLLFAADRTEHVKEIKKLSVYELLIISDRYLFSSIAYQSMNMISMVELINLNKNFPLPKITFFLDTPVDICLKRIHIRNKKHELYETKDKLKKIKNNYEKCFDFFFPKPSNSFYRINGSLSSESIHNKVVSILKSNRIISQNEIIQNK